MKNIAIRYGLRTPVMNMPTLDALIANQIFKETDCLIKAHQDLPLLHTQGLWHASSAILEEAQDILPIQFIAALRPSDIKDMNEIVPNNKAKNSVVWDEKRKRDCGNVANQYDAKLAKAAWFFCQTDKPQELERLLKKITHLGKKANRGFGEVTDIQIQACSVNGVVDHQGQPLRPIPITMAKTFKVQADSIKADHAWLPPYWKPDNRTFCYMPPERHWTELDIDEELL